MNREEGIGGTHSRIYHMDELTSKVYELDPDTLLGIDIDSLVNIPMPVKKVFISCSHCGSSRRSDDINNCKNCGAPK